MGRMLCGDCGALEDAVTRLPGSDRLERLGWLLGALPGWLYCGVRHALREKACAHCGGGNLVRETRASAAVSAPPAGEPRIESGPARSPWPEHLRTPRARLRRAPAWAAAWWLAMSAAAVPIGALLALALVAPDAAQWWRRRSAPRCEAWDASGRSLRIELA